MFDIQYSIFNIASGCGDQDRQSQRELGRRYLQCLVEGEWHPSKVVIHEPAGQKPGTMQP
jgi:hypothetical protein